jgi:hypothetical protein
VRLKTEIVNRVGRILVQVDILDPAATFDGANHKALSVGKATNAGCRVLQRRGENAEWIEVVAEDLAKVPVVNKHL